MSADPLAAESRVLFGDVSPAPQRWTVQDDPAIPFPLAITVFASRVSMAPALVRLLNEETES